MQLNVLLKTSSLCSSANDIEYKKLVSKKLAELRAFTHYIDDWGEPSVLPLCKNSYGNTDLFINTGIVQSLIKDCAYFRGGNGYVLSLQLMSGCTWRQVYDKIKYIDSINIQTN